MVYISDKREFYHGLLTTVVAGFGEGVCAFYQAPWYDHAIFVAAGAAGAGIIVNSLRRGKNLESRL